MRTLLCLAVVWTACAPGDRSRAPAGPAQKYAGTWEGRSFRSASDTGTPWRIVTAVAPDGSLRGTLLDRSITGEVLVEAHRAQIAADPCNATVLVGRLTNPEVSI